MIGTTFVDVLKRCANTRAQQLNQIYVDTISGANRRNNSCCYLHRKQCKKER